MRCLLTERGRGGFRDPLLNISYSSTLPDAELTGPGRGRQSEPGGREPNHRRAQPVGDPPQAIREQLTEHVTHALKPAGFES